MASAQLTPLGALCRGLVAGVAGTAALTVSQVVVAKIRGGEPPQAAGEVGRRAVEGVFLEEVEEERVPVLNQVVHWTYGSAWGGMYGLLQESLRLPPALHGALFGGLVVGGAATVELPALKMMPPPWKVPPLELAINTFHHVVYGLVAAATYEALRGGSR